LQEALNKDGNFLKEIVRSIIQQLIEKERDQQAGVLSHKRDNTKRKANRNGYKSRSFNTRIGNPAFWPFAEGLFCFYKFIVGKEGFLNISVAIINY